MNTLDYNPALQAVVSIRHLALGLSTNWKQMKEIGNDLDNLKSKANVLVKKYVNSETALEWDLELQKLQKNINSLKAILGKAITQIKNRETNNLSNNWKSTNEYSEGISDNYKNLRLIGSKCLPENEKDSWIRLWSEAFVEYDKMINESNACGIQLKMIEEYKPEEVDEMTATILKYIPLKYSNEEADKYEKEYLKAYQEIKSEVSQKKNLWDKFLDILAGGTQQTPAQRVMMQRWVNGERDNQ